MFLMDACGTIGDTIVVWTLNTLSGFMMVCCFGLLPSFNMMSFFQNANDTVAFLKHIALQVLKMKISLTSCLMHVETLTGFS